MIANHKGEIPVVILLISFIAGIAGGIYFNFIFGWLTVLLLLYGISFAVLGLGYAQFKIYQNRWLGGFLIHPILFLLGWAAATGHNELNSTDHFAKSSAQYLAVTVTNEPRVKGDLVSFTAAAKHSINVGKTTSVSGNILITIKDDLAKKLFYGEELLIPAKFAAVDPPFNPGEFNYKQYLANHNIHCQAFLYPGQYVIIKAGQGNPVIAYALTLRQKLVRKFQADMCDTNAIAVASTLILGYKADLSNDILQAYSKTGTIHILSVSGGHVAIIYLLLSWLMRFLNSSQRGRILKALIIITLIWAYSLLTGFSPAVCRAAIMLSLIITGKTYAQYINTLNILAVSAFAMLLYDPFLTTDVGFQLSYLAVAGLVIFQPIVYNWFHFSNWFGDKIWMACSVSIAAQVITFPLSAYYFHQFPVYFLMSNLLIAIPVAAILYIGIALLLLPQMPFVSQGLGYVLESCIVFMNKVLAYIEQAPYASIGKIWLTTSEYVLLYAITLSAFYFIYSKKAGYIKAALAGVLLFSLSIGIKHLKIDNSQSITFLNLRKHSGIVFKNGRQGVVLTDVADTDKNFQYAIQPGLDSNRITNYKIYNFGNDIRAKYLLKHQGIVQFLDKKLLLLNQSSPLQSIPQHFNIDYLFTANNMFTDSTLMTRSKMMIIDGSNTEKHVKQLIMKAELQNIKYYNLRRNKSLTVLSK
ncbi:ComEC/Rec2 family competence protein [Mucilaginibacter glaciei]|uniref:ComEC family competence protein n=1 Tax=Mucilaginibacter glaciei TaxID=2772109 RepID=A0A926S0H4_9SPHI|nr:ComEC/Rec2 family competence protein [Mucilaginibacter glaciei]MBD1391737.1 ComEC family competence protein [Mucilaginibacter glaciei]